MFLAKKSLLIILSFVMLVSLSTACKETPPKPPVQNVFMNTLEIPDKPNLSALPDLETNLDEKVLEKHSLNDDSMGWLNVKGTSLDDVVMYKPLGENNSDKHYYLRRDFDGNSLFEGTYYLDYRSKFDGGREGMSRNNVVYGHSMTDNPDDYIFSQLKKFKNEDFARKTPYIFFSTLEGDMAWEVFAVFVTNVDVPYNNPNLDDEQFIEMIENVRNKSFYDYDVGVGTQDKILTLSTCLYEVNGKPISYPNDYRYVVMAKLVPSKEILRDEAALEINEDAVPA